MILPGLLAALAVSLPPAAPAAATPGGLRVETEVSFAANLVHWVDNLAGTSLGKTAPVYRRHWEQRFGPPDGDDRAALEEFARIRRRRIRLPAAGPGNAAGCLPVSRDTPGWHQIFLIETMKARTIDDLLRALGEYLPPGDTAALGRSLERFRPRFEKIWKEDLAFLPGFERRFDRFLEGGDLAVWLDRLAGFFGVVPGSAPPMKISFMGLPVDGATHAEADGDHLLIEIRPLDHPRDQIQVVSHEAAHFLMRRMTPEQIDGLARQAYRGGDAGPLVWRLMWEGLPTTLGQGLAEARLTPDRFSTGVRWYHLPSIDRFAKLIFPAVAEAVAASRRLDDGLMSELTRVIGQSNLLVEARPAELLMTAFFASGDGLEPQMESLRRKLGLHPADEAVVFDLADPAGADLLRRYECLGGVALLGAHELERGARLDGTTLLSPESVRHAVGQVSRGIGVIATARRSGGGTIYYLVSPDAGATPALVDAFTRLRGVPDRPVLVPADGAAAR